MAHRLHSVQPSRLAEVPSGPDAVAEVCLVTGESFIAGGVRGGAA